MLTPLCSTARLPVVYTFPKYPVDNGEAAAALLREADEIGADMIVVGNKRVQGFTRFLGSIARTIASEAHCDLYIVNTHQR